MLGCRSAPETSARFGRGRVDLTVLGHCRDTRFERLLKHPPCSNPSLEIYSPCKSSSPPSDPIIAASPIRSFIPSPRWGRTSPRSRCTTTTRSGSFRCSRASTSTRARYDELRQAMVEVSRGTKLSIRTWSPDITGRPPRLAICVTFRPEPATALLRAIRDGQVKAEPTLMISNRDTCRGVAEEFGVPWFSINRGDGTPDDDRLMELCDEHDVDFIVLARYMRILPAASCWKYAGGRIINLHHGLLAELPRHEALPRRLRQPDAHLRLHLPLHRAGARRRQPDHLSVDVSR